MNPSAADAVATPGLRVVAVSDLHGFLPAIPPCDLLLLAGDLTPVHDHRMTFQAHWLDTTFRAWLRQVPARHIVGVAGNHDFVFQHGRHLLPTDLPWIYLEDTGTVVSGYRIWGSPWQPVFLNWAFNAEESELARRWQRIPESTDILLLHGPPYGAGDAVPETTVTGSSHLRHCGSRALRDRLVDGLFSCRLAVYGHIHEGRGVYRVGRTVCANVSYVDGRYQPLYRPMVWDVTARDVQEVCDGDAVGVGHPQLACPAGEQAC